MRKYVIFSILLLTMVMVNAQEDNSDSSLSKAIPFAEIDYDGKYYNFVIEEQYEGEFEEDPVTFLNTYFDAPGFLKKVSHEKVSGLEMIFKTSRGSLKASLDKEGKINKTFHKCKDILVPRNVQAEIYRKYPGWTMVKNQHITKSNGGKLDEEYFKVKLIKDGKVKKVKIQQDIGLAGN